MTDLRTRPVEEQRWTETAPGIPTATRGRIIVLSLVLGVLILAVVGLDFTSAGTSRAELDQARWQQLVDYYERQFQTSAEARARSEAAHWQDIINYYVRQYEVMADAGSRSATARWSAHWDAVVDYYEQRWELQEK